MAFKGKLMASGGNAKTVKGDALHVYETAIMHLAPYTSAGGSNVCAMAETAKCIDGCLNTAGRAAMFANIPAARIAKTRRYLTYRKQFLADLVRDVEAFVWYCERKGVKPAVRLNGTSDIQWERGHMVTRSYTVPTADGVVKREQTFPSIMAAFPEVQFYDYTKIPQRVLRGTLPSNYALTLSYSGANQRYATAVRDAIEAVPVNMAVVFRDKATVQRALAFGWNGLDVIDGDQTDMRFIDPQGGYVVALYAKGKAKHDCSGFVVD